VIEGDRLIGFWYREKNSSLIMFLAIKIDNFGVNALYFMRGV
jgi:hypothetical protein